MQADNHTHTYDEHGNITCCSLEEKIELESSRKSTMKKSVHSDTYQNDQDEHIHNQQTKHEHNHEDDTSYWGTIISILMLITALILEHGLKANFFKGTIIPIWYVIAYIPVAFPVIQEAWKTLRKGEIFTEFFLMTIATLGAFAIGEYPEAVAVMLFYSIGELFQIAAVKRAKNNISDLLDVRSKFARVYRHEKFLKINPADVKIGEKIQVLSGEKIPLDGILLSDLARLNTSALTGESVPESIQKSEEVYAGSINLNHVIEMEVTKLNEDSSISKILELIQHASSKKAKTELLIRKLAKFYTPIVVYLAVAIVVIPYFFVSDYLFADWLYRALIFLVISCPCALVISIPLGYFGGLGAASKHGILFKGASYLDAITKVNVLVMDKTGTLTKGVFNVQSIKSIGLDEKKFMEYLLALEAYSTHPIARAIMQYGADLNVNETFIAKNITEIPGKGITGEINDSIVIAGNLSLLKSYDIHVPDEIIDQSNTIVFLAINKVCVGYLTISDELKEDARTFVQNVKKSGIHDIRMLSGDRQKVTESVANALDISSFKGDLFPEDKLHEVQKIQENPKNIVAFMGDGINDGPVLALSNIGIAMGAKGSDLAIETADVIIQTDQPSKVISAIKIGKATQKIIWQNIGLALGVKIFVLILGAGGLATMWEAVFADVGVALLAILNAVRIQRMSF